MKPGAATLMDKISSCILKGSPNGQLRVIHVRKLLKWMLI